jgi:SOS-response transcriptional repressor LexA
MLELMGAEDTIKGYIVRIRDDSMQPTLPCGWFAYVVPVVSENDIHPGDAVLVDLPEGTTVLSFFVARDQTGKLLLMTPNGPRLERRLSWSPPGLRLVGIVVAVRPEFEYNLGGRLHPAELEEAQEETNRSKRGFSDVVSASGLLE